MATNQRLQRHLRKKRQKLRRLDRHPPRLGHETMLAVPAFRRGADALTERLRVSPGAAPPLVQEEDFQTPAVDRLLEERYALVRQLYGWSHDDALLELNQLCTYLATAVNHALAGKKTFWVSAELAAALRQTNLDIPGDVLQLPFAACAYVFNDPATVGLVQTLIEQYAPPRAAFRTLTVYVYPSRKDDDCGFEFVFLADSYDGEWPYMISRSVLTDGKRNLDEILDSHPTDSTDPMFFAPEMAELLRLAANAVLYTTSADYRAEPRAGAPRGLTAKHATLTSDEVYYLPGRIRIDGASTADAPAGRQGTTIHKRFWVRGHWRRANAGWQDQRVRWIEPYLKGPDTAAIIEREYELVGAPAFRA